MIKPNIYFAHSKLDYGSFKEKLAIHVLSKYWNVFCPNNNLGFEITYIKSESKRINNILSKNKI